MSGGNIAVASDGRSLRLPSGGHPGEFPFEILVALVQSVGKHFLPAGVLDTLARTRAERARPGLLRDFLDCLLDKHDGRYRYDSYLALPILQELIAGNPPRLTPTELGGLLVADAVRFEIEALRGRQGRRLAEGRPGPLTVAKRVRNGLRHLVRVGLPGVDDRLVRHSHRIADPRTADLVLRELPAPADPEVALRLRLSVLPVYMLHDEYLFLRVLQSYEMVFAALVGLAGQARDALLGGLAGPAAERVPAAAGCLDRAGHLFTLLATMDGGAFRAFRQFTEGASAIQSERYKRFELVCARPPLRRLASPAFDNVPRVRAELRSGPPTIASAYLAALAAKRIGRADNDRLCRTLAELERSHQRWKTTQHSLAARMLADSPGSGYTAGVPYLRAAIDNRLFWQLAAVAGRERGADAECA